jgi:hypothetical protein
MRQSWPNLRGKTSILLVGLRKTRKTLVRTAGLHANIRSRGFKTYEPVDVPWAVLSAAIVKYFSFQTTLVRSSCEESCAHTDLETNIFNNTTTNETF